MRRLNKPIKNQSFYSRIIVYLREKGLLNLVYKGLQTFALLPIYFYYKTFKFGSKFTVGGRSFCYFYAFLYNKTWRTERCVEIPIVLDIVNHYHGQSILEVGNVLSHFFTTNHDILDYYERADGIINQDIADFKPCKKYKLIVSISTIEHIGWDETPRDKGKIARVIENMKSMLEYEGQILLTFPVGYNNELDDIISNEKYKFEKIFCLRRIGINKWQETDWEDLKYVNYGTPYPHANGLAIAMIKNS